MKRRTNEELLEDLKRNLTTPKWAYTLNIDDWFFPSDVSPNNPGFKRQCIKLYKAGLLDRTAMCGRWGYRYHIKALTTTTDEKK